MFQTKTVAAFFLAVLSFVDLIFWAFKVDSQPVDLTEPVIRLLTFVAVVVVVQAERKRGRRISPIQFVSGLSLAWVQSYKRNKCRIKLH